MERETKQVYTVMQVHKQLRTETMLSSVYESPIEATEQALALLKSCAAHSFFYVRTVTLYPAQMRDQKAYSPFPQQEG